MNTPREFFTGMSDDLSKVGGLGAVYQFNITGDDGGEWYVDAVGDEPSVGEGAHDNPDATFSCADQDFMDIATGRMPSQMAFMLGKLRVSGNMALAIRLQKVFG